MNWYLVWLTLLVLFLMSNVKVLIQLKRIDENDLLRLEVQYFFGLIKIKFNIPVMKLKSLYQGLEVKGKVTSDLAEKPDPPKGKSFLTPRKFKDFLQLMSKIRDRVRDMNEISKRILKYVRCEKWEWQTTIGTGDAASTGTFTGLVWGVKGSILGIVSHYIDMQTKPSFRVVPAFQRQALNIHFMFIFRLRIVHSFIAIFTIVIRLIRSQLRMRFGVFKV